MFIFIFSGPVIFSVIFFLKFLACANFKNYGKNMKNFPGSPKYDAKHWAIVNSSIVNCTNRKCNGKVSFTIANENLK